MVSKTIVKWAGVAGIMALAACTGVTGPLTECTLGDDNITVCSTPQAEPADAGIEQIIQ